MDFTLTDEQELLRDTARALLTRECPPALVRAHMEDPSVADALWKHLADWTALADGPCVDLCLFLEEMGAVVAPGPFFPTVAVFGPLLGAVDHPLAARVMRGELTGTVALAGRAGQWVPNAEPVKCFVPEAEWVDVVAAVSVASRPDTANVALAERPTVTFTQTIDPSRRLATVDTRAFAPEATAARLQPVSLEVPAAAIADVLERAVVALSAELLGTTRWLFDTTLAYAKQREQFGRPIGSFQAIKHKLANMALARERAWAAVYYAAMCIDASDEDRHRAAHVAKAAAGSAAKLCAKDGIQIHGGIGYTWEHDLHLYIRRAYGSEHLLGTSEWHEDRLADLLLPP